MSHCRWVVVAEESFDQLCQKRAAEAAGDGISTPPPSTNLAVPPPNSPTSRPKAQQSSPPSSQQSAVNVPKAQDLTPTSPNLTEQVPSTQDQLPSTQDQLPSTQDQLPRAQDKLPSSQADHPAAARDGRAPTKGKWRQKTEATPGGLSKWALDLPPSFRRDGRLLLQKLDKARGLVIDDESGDITLNGQPLGLTIKELLRTTCIPHYPPSLPLDLQVWLRRNKLLKFRNHLVKIRPQWKSRYSSKMYITGTRPGHFAVRELSTNKQKPKD